MLIKALSNRTKSKQTDQSEKTSIRDEPHVNNTVETLTIQDDMQKQPQEKDIESDKNQPTISSSSNRNSSEIDLIEPVKKKQKKIILSHLLDDEDDD